MARDDYFVIAAKVLDYLYKCLKRELLQIQNCFLRKHLVSMNHTGTIFFRTYQGMDTLQE